ncbi:hypothetical protein GCM10010172_62220 [Paractinoplanes ferrugineus]|uniref:Uncharacterized protein n=1 Tax=Paractinoplanes ferrugineus TaxID=113564 RepID=A0A919J863_9ACTN|nr:hypothetical protein Afe05nite_84560 [Actinoplanes ferrugineus]
MFQSDDEIFAGAGDPRPDGADRAATHLGRLGVRQTCDLGEEEGLPAVIGEVADQLGQRMPDVVGGDPAGNHEQPGTHGGFALERRQGAHDPQVGFLRQILNLGGRAQRGKEPRDVTLGQPDEVGQGVAVTAGCGTGQTGEGLGHLRSTHGG